MAADISVIKMFDRVWIDSTGLSEFLGGIKAWWNYPDNYITISMTMHGVTYDETNVFIDKEDVLNYLDVEKINNEKAAELYEYYSK